MWGALPSCIYEVADGFREPCDEGMGHHRTKLLRLLHTVPHLQYRSFRSTGVVSTVYHMVEPTRGPVICPLDQLPTESHSVYLIGLAA